MLLTWLTRPTPIALYYLQSERPSIIKFGSQRRPSAHTKEFNLSKFAREQGKQVVVVVVIAGVIITTLPAPIGKQTNVSMSMVGVAYAWRVCSMRLNNENSPTVQTQRSRTNGRSNRIQLAPSMGLIFSLGSPEGNPISGLSWPLPLSVSALWALWPPLRMQIMLFATQFAAHKPSTGEPTLALIGTQKSFAPCESNGPRDTKSFL